MPKSPRLSRTIVAAASAAVAVSAAAAAGSHPAVAAAKPTAKDTAVGPQITIQKYTLPNGLRVVLAPDSRKEAAPVIAVNVTYDVGSRNERPGRSGFAHLFEHMMFQGSADVGKGEHIYLVNSNGGTMNGTTNQDRTNYFESLPANQLELALFLESDRMRALDVTEDNLTNQRAVVQEEKRQSYDNQPYGHVYEAMLDQAYSSFPYKHTTIGSMEDLDAATLADVRQFHDMYYAPNNAVLTVTGRFDPGDARALIAKYFAPIPKVAAPPPVVFSEPTIYPGERRKELTDPLARQVQYTAGYVTVAGNDPDFYPLSILGDILAGGKTSRLYQALVEKNKTTGISAGLGDQRGPGLFMIRATLPPGVEVSEVEGIINDSIARVQQDGVTADEVAIAVAAERVDNIRSMQTALSRANLIGYNTVAFNDPERINTILSHFQAVTPEDVRRVAQKYLVTANRSVVVAKPAASDAAGNGAQ